MSTELGRLELPNGGELAVTAYAGPGRKGRMQFTLTQGEGGIVAHGNTNADGVAELLGWLETWLRGTPHPRGSQVHRKPDDVSLASVDGPAPSRAREELELEELPIWSRAGVRVRLARALEIIAGREEDRDATAHGLGADLAEELEKLLRGTLELVDRDVFPAAPASDRLEANDVSTSLEDFGKLGEERDEAFTRALELRRQGVRLTIGNVANAVREVQGMASALEEYCVSEGQRRPAVAARTVLEREELTQHAARYLLAVRGLEELLRLAADEAHP